MTSLRIALALLARADELVPLVAASGEMVGVSRSLILRLALVEGCGCWGAVWEGVTSLTELSWTAAVGSDRPPTEAAFALQ